MKLFTKILVVPAIFGFLMAGADIAGPIQDQFIWSMAGLILIIASVGVGVMYERIVG